MRLSTLYLGAETPTRAYLGGVEVWSAFSGPLDAYADDLAAAYSLRRLLASYEGSAVRVRRDSDNATLDIGFLSDGSLDTPALLAFVGAGSGYVVVWYDQRGLRDASQASPSSQPRIASAGAVKTRGGAPTVDFDGANHSLSLPSKPFTGTVGRSFFVVGGADSTSIAEAIFDDGTNLSGASGAAYLLSSEVAVRVSGNATFASSYVSFGLRLLSHTLPSNGTTSDAAIWLDGSPVAQNGSTGTPVNTSVAGTPLIGARTDNPSFYDGGISELIVYASDKSSDRPAIEGALASYYGIPLPT